ncbi:hypothetical protein SRHO_G00071200 [Serrasalmus rhombeus]
MPAARAHITTQTKAQCTAKRLSDHTKAMGPCVCLGAFEHHDLQDIDSYGCPRVQSPSVARSSSLQSDDAKLR